MGESAAPLPPTEDIPQRSSNPRPVGLPAESESLTVANPVNKLGKHSSAPTLRAIDLAVGLSFLGLMLGRRIANGWIDLTNLHEAASLVSTIVLSAVLVFSYRPKKVLLNKRIALAVLLSSLPGFFAIMLETPNAPAVYRTAHMVSWIYDFIYITALINLGRNFGVFPSLRKISQDGLYSRLRHPLYSVYIHTQLLVTLLDPRWIQFAVLACISIGLTMRLLDEERVLSTSTEFLAYRERVKTRIFHPILSLPLVVLGVVKLIDLWQS